MKVLSIKEPYASLIKERVKLIETRSWKTSYRGELYIHASKAKVDFKKNQEILKFLTSKDFNYGCIIAKCNLVDCVYIDKSFIEKIKKNKVEYICGDYQVGRYGWVLENVEVLEEPIPAKGKLNIWNYDD